MIPLWIALAAGPPGLDLGSEDTKGEATALETRAATGAAGTPSTGSTDAASAPESLFTRPPALSALGDDATKFDEPGTPMDFAVSIGDFFTETGALKPGGAVEVGARGLGLTRHVTAAQYRASYGLRTLSHSYLSLASTKRVVDNADDDVLLALGLRTALLHGGDPLIQQAYIDAVDAVEAECAARTAADPALDPVACRTEAYPRLAAALPDPRWNAPGLVLSAAFTGAWLGGQYTAFQAEEASVWVTGTMGLADWGQLGLATAWTQSLHGEANVFSPTLRFRAGLGGTRLTAEAAWLAALPPTGGLQSGYRASLGGEFRVQGGSWVHGNFGLEFAPDEDRVSLLGGLSFRWGQASEPSFKPEPAATSTNSPTSPTGKATAGSTR